MCGGCSSGSCGCMGQQPHGVPAGGRITAPCCSALGTGGPPRHCCSLWGAAYHCCCSVHLEQVHVAQPLIRQAVAAVHHHASGAGGGGQPAARRGQVAACLQLVPVPAGRVHACASGAGGQAGGAVAARGQALGGGDTTSWMRRQGNEMNCTLACAHRRCRCCTCPRRRGPRLQALHGFQAERGGASADGAHGSQAQPASILGCAAQLPSTGNPNQTLLGS